MAPCHNISLLVCSRCYNKILPSGNSKKLLLWRESSAGSVSGVNPFIHSQVAFFLCILIGGQPRHLSGISFMRGTDLTNEALSSESSHFSMIPPLRSLPWWLGFNLGILEEDINVSRIVREKVMITFLNKIDILWEMGKSAGYDSWV